MTDVAIYGEAFDRVETCKKSDGDDVYYIRLGKDHDQIAIWVKGNVIRELADKIGN